MWGGEQYAITAPRVGAGIEVLSFCFLEAHRARAQRLVDQVLAGSTDVPRQARIERAGRDVYAEWGASSHGVKPYFVYLRGVR